MLLQEYDRYLRVERRAGEVTITQYLRYASEFLTAAGEPADGPETGARLAALDGARVLDVVSRQAARHRLASIGAVLTGDRAFLRFLERTGRTTRPLAAAVPLAARPPSRLPEQVDPATAAVILASCDRATEGGCRDRAVLLLLHRYGLRPVEVTRLELPDLRWRAGEFVVHGKAGRVNVLPLLRDVGEAIVEYLRIRLRRLGSQQCSCPHARRCSRCARAQSVRLPGGPAPGSAFPGPGRGRSGTRSGTTC